jgi:hypothetical protein
MVGAQSDTVLYGSFIVSVFLPSVTVRWYQFVYKQDQKPEDLITMFVVKFTSSGQTALWCLASCEPAQMVQLGWGSGYCISAESAVIRCKTHGPQNLLVLVLVFEYCASPVTHSYGSMSHELHCWLLGDINTEPLTVPVGCISVSYSVVQNSSCRLWYCVFFTVF